MGALLLALSAVVITGCSDEESDNDSASQETPPPAETPAIAAALPDTPDADDALPPSKLLNLYCGACHTPTNNGGLSRISNIRKTPEGWDMSIVRMTLHHDVEIPKNVRARLVKYLADAQGLAPRETRGHRAVLERRHNVVETGMDPELNVMCARCHSNARYALQRRDADEWRLLVNMHVGQWPSIEYQALARDRDWWEIASGQVAEKLGALYPLETKAWSDWRAAPRQDMSGTWAVTGHWPGHGDYAGTMKIEGQGDDGYLATYALTTSAGETLAVTTKAIVYTGYEWRGRGAWGDAPIKEIYALSEDGQTLTGRWYFENSFEIGADFSAARLEDGVAHITSVWPATLESGDSADITITGANLEGAVSLGPNIKAQVMERSANKIIVRAKAKCSAAPSVRTITVGTARLENALTLFEDVDYLRVTPPFGIARLGDGMTPPITAQFEAIGYTNGPDGVAGTQDDIRIGPLQAEWRVEPHNAVAKELQDVKYAGTLDQSGFFTPAEAGPNRKRKQSRDNVGDLNIVASVPTYDGKAEGAAHLMVVVQKWNNPPIQ